VLRYADAKRQQHRSVRLLTDASPAQPNARLVAFLLAGDTQAAHWVSDLLLERLPAQIFGRALLAGTPKPPVALPSRGAQICNCFDVTEPDITKALRSCSGDAAARLSQLQDKLACGTHCGSCLPALRQLVQRRVPTNQPAVTGT